MDNKTILKIKEKNGLTTQYLDPKAVIIQCKDGKHFGSFEMEDITSIEIIKPQEQA